MTIPEMIIPSKYQRKCGRLTRSGTPCKNRADGFLPACTIHATADEKILDQMLRQVERLGRSEGYESGRSMAQLTIDHLNKQLSELKHAEDVRLRRFSVGTDQIVEVRGYAYRWAGDHPPLVVGDWVLLPAAWPYSSEPWTAQVSALGSCYSGETRSILRKVEKPVYAESSSIE